MGRFPANFQSGIACAHACEGRGAAENPGEGDIGPADSLRLLGRLCSQLNGPVSLYIKNYTSSLQHTDTYSRRPDTRRPVAGKTERQEEH